MTQDTNGKVTNSQLDTTNESQEVSPFPAGDHKAHINRRSQRHSKHKTEKNIFKFYNLGARPHFRHLAPHHSTVTYVKWVRKRDKYQNLKDWLIYYSCIDFYSYSCLNPLSNERKSMFKSGDSRAVWTWVCTWKYLKWALHYLHDVIYG